VKCVQAGEAVGFRRDGSSRSVGRQRQGDEPGEGGDEGVLPWPVAVDPEVESSAAADQAGGDVQQPVTQLFGLGGGKSAVKEQQPGPGEQAQARPTSSTQTVLTFSCRDGRWFRPVF